MFSYCLLVVLLLSCVGLCTGDEFIIDAESGMMTIPKTCLHTCRQGACLYNGCENTKCPGGACHFVDCVNPSCGGGACIFERCKGAQCPGGSCTFRDPPETLRAGYCDGGNCNIEGQPHPDLYSHLTI